MKKLVLAVTVLALCSLSFAGTPSATKINSQKEATAALGQKSAAQSVPRSPLATSTCSFTFTSGVNNTFLKYCVTVNGNITQLQTPLGHEHIAVGSFGEGYGVCDTTTTVGYFDYADFGDSGNWGAPVTTHTLTSVKVVRSTSDGIWTLTQVITQVAASSSVKVAMTLKNNTAVARFAYIMRYADVDANSTFSNTQDGTTNNAFSYTEEGFGLQLQNAGNPPAGFGWVGYPQNSPSGPAPCTPFATFVNGPILATDGSIVEFYDGTFPALGSKTVTVNYKGL